MPRKIVKPRSQQAGRKGELVLWGVILGALLVVIGYGAVLAIRGMGSTQPVSPTVAVGGDIRRVPVAEARAMVDAGTAVLVDTRTTEYYNRQHARGALSLPAGQEAALVNTLPRDKLVIFYCT